MPKREITLEELRKLVRILGAGGGAEWAPCGDRLEEKLRKAGDEEGAEEARALTTKLMGLRYIPPTH
jgi:hypothetical protein